MSLTSRCLFHWKIKEPVLFPPTWRWSNGCISGNSHSSPLPLAPPSGPHRRSPSASTLKFLKAPSESNKFNQSSICFVSKFAVLFTAVDSFYSCYFLNFVVCIIHIYIFFYVVCHPDRNFILVWYSLWRRCLQFWYYYWCPQSQPVLRTVNRVC